MAMVKSFLLLSTAFFLAACTCGPPETIQLNELEERCGSLPCGIKLVSGNASISAIHDDGSGRLHARRYLGFGAPPLPGLSAWMEGRTGDASMTIHGGNVPVRSTKNVRPFCGIVRLKNVPVTGAEYRRSATLYTPTT